MIWSICGAFYQKRVDQANKRLFDPYRVSKKLKWPYFGLKIGIYMDVIKILGLVKSFEFNVWCICGAFYQKWIDQANKRLFDPYRVSKKYKMALFWHEKWDIWM